MSKATDQTILEERVAELLPLVEKPARYLDGEINVVHHEWSPARLRWLLILPDVYEIGMSHQGLRILYDLLNEREDALAERAFAPWTDMEARMRAARIPLFSLESRRPARDFDVVGFSLQYELLASNILNLCDLAGIPLWSRERSEQDPLIAAGGPCTGNPEPLADFIDFFLIGDGEEAVLRIHERLLAERGRPRSDRLRRLAEIPGVYVPRFYEPRYGPHGQIRLKSSAGVPAVVRRTHVRDLDAAPYPRRPIVPLIEAVQDRLTLEIQRGCTQGCRFCQAGIFYRPVRERSPQRLVELAAAGLATSGWESISLSSLSSADYSQIRPLTHKLSDALAPGRIGLSFSSLRVDTFSVELAELVSRVRKSGLTFAPEAGTDRLRRVINKGIRDDEILAAIEAAYAKGWRRVKLYFMIGLPTESEADLEGLVDLIDRVRTIGRRFGASRSVTASIGAFVPKAHTPFQWEAFAGRECLRERLAFVKDRARGRGAEVKWHDLDLSFVEAVFSRGDRRLAAVIHRAWQQGARFDGWTEYFSIDRWNDAFDHVGIDPHDYTRARDPQVPLPWDHIDLGVTKPWLLREADAARQGQLTPDCRTGRCSQCGLGGPRDRQLAPELTSEEWERLGGLLTSAPTPVRESAPVRCRLVFAKRGLLRFIAHLETGHLLVRLFRMARWPLAFTAGHAPRPKISFGPPLPLGVEGERELLDITLTRALTAEEIAAVNARAPRGLTIQQAQRDPPTGRSLMLIAAAAIYHVHLPAELRELARRERRLEQFAASGERIVLKASKGRQKSVDLKRCLRRISWSDPARGLRTGEPCGPREEPAGGSPQVPDLTMEMLLQEPGGHVLGPLPALEELFKWSREDLARCRVVRACLLDDGDRPLHAPAARAI